MGTVGLAVLILSLTIWGSGTVRKASTVMSLLIIAGMLIIYSSNLVANFPRLLQVMRELPEAEGGFWPAPTIKTCFWWGFFNGGMAAACGITPGEAS